MSTKSFQKYDIISDKLMILYFKENENTNISDKIHDTMVLNQYRLEYGDKANGKYVRGTKWKRLLLGIFHKHFEFVFTLSTEGELIKLNFLRESSGLSGGILGIKQVKDEMTSLTLQLSSL